MLEVLVALAIMGIAIGSVYFGLIRTNELAYQTRNRTSAGDIVSSLSDLVLAVNFKPSDQGLPLNNDASVQLRRQTAVPDILKNATDVQRTGRMPNSNAIPGVFAARAPNPNIYTDATRQTFTFADTNLYDGTRQTTYNVPVYISADGNRADINGDPRAQAIVQGTLTRSIANMADSLPVGAGTETGTSMRVRTVEFVLTYNYRGRNYEKRLRTFRAPTE